MAKEHIEIKRSITKFQKKYSSAISLIFKRFSQGFTQVQIIEELVRSDVLTRAKAVELVEASKFALVNISPDFAIEVVGQVRLGLATTMLSIEELYESAENKHEQAQALALKLKALAQLRDLVPRQIQMDHKVQEDDARRILFEVHGLDKKIIDGE